jgi:hypothetical protein
MTAKRTTDRNAKRRTSAKVGSTLRLARKMPVKVERQKAYVAMLESKASMLVSQRASFPKYPGLTKRQLGTELVRAAMRLGVVHACSSTCAHD